MVPVADNVVWSPPMLIMALANGVFSVSLMALTTVTSFTTVRVSALVVEREPVETRRPTLPSNMPPFGAERVTLLPAEISVKLTSFMAVLSFDVVVIDTVPVGDTASTSSDRLI